MRALSYSNPLTGIVSCTCLLMLVVAFADNVFTGDYLGREGRERLGDRNGSEG